MLKLVRRVARALRSPDFRGGVCRLSFGMHAKRRATDFLVAFVARDRAADAGSFDVVDDFPPTHRGSVTDGE